MGDGGPGLPQAYAGYVDGLRQGLHIEALWVEEDDDGLWSWQVSYNRDPTAEERAGVHAVLDCLTAMAEAARDNEGPLH